VPIFSGPSIGVVAALEFSHILGLTANTAPLAGTPAVELGASVATGAAPVDPASLPQAANVNALTEASAIRFMVVILFRGLPLVGRALGCHCRRSFFDA
jgi:hypothetical protein